MVLFPYIIVDSGSESVACLEVSTRKIKPQNRCQQSKFMLLMLITEMTVIQYKWNCDSGEYQIPLHRCVCLHSRPYPYSKAHGIFPEPRTGSLV